MNCLKCSGPLTAYNGRPQDAPWVCNNGCMVGFFNAELSPAAAHHYRQAFNDYGTGPHTAILRAAVLTELEQRGHR